MSIRADDLEGVVIARMFWHLRKANVGDIKQIRAKKLGEKRKRVADIERTLQVIDVEIAALEENMTEITIKPVVKQLETKMARLLAQKEQLVNEREGVVQSYQDMPASSLEEELKDLEELWTEKPFRLKKALIELLIKKVVIDYVTPRFYKVQVEWNYSEWGTEERLIDRRMAGSKEWTESEKHVLTAMYAQGNQIDIMQALPQRTWSSIVLTATNMGLRRQGRKREVIEDHTITIDDLRLLNERRLTLSDLSVGNLNVWS